MNSNARTGVIGLGSGVTLGGPLGVMMNHFFTATVHWYPATDDAMVSAVTGGAMTFMSIVALVINHYFAGDKPEKSS